MATDEEWTVEANDAITVSLVQPSGSGLKQIESFHPQFTYAIFGEEEHIFGYKGLRINLSYNASDLRPNVAVKLTRRFETVSGVEATDVVGTLKDYLPGVAFQKRADYELAIKQVPNNWTPPGDLIKTIERDGDIYEVWKGNLADAAVKQLVNRIQICVLFFIEGGSYIGKDEDGKDEPDNSLARWSVYFLYKKQRGVEGQKQYIFQGYSTIYRFWLFEPLTPPASPTNEPIQLEENPSWELPQGGIPYEQMSHRSRISQFVILPPFQGKGAGAMLYNTIFEIQSQDAATKEVTVEDPNEAFDLLRDLCDMKYLRKNVPEFAELSITPGISVPQKGGLLHHNLQVTHANSASSPKTILDIEALKTLRAKVKIAPRQFSRLVEMHLMSKLPPSVRPLPETSDMGPPKKISAADQNIYTLWRLLLKQRLYRRNATILNEFEITDRIIKLNETLENVEWEYTRILERLDAPRPGIESNGESKGKRKLGDETNGEGSSKKVRVEDQAEDKV